MRSTPLTLIVLAILALAAGPAAQAADTPPTQILPADQAAPLLSLDPTDGASEVDHYPSCADDDIQYTSFFLEPEQVCIDYCTNNGWEYLDYADLGRGLYVCVCCTA